MEPTEEFKKILSEAALLGVAPVKLGEAKASEVERLSQVLHAPKAALKRFVDAVHVTALREKVDAVKRQMLSLEPGAHAVDYRKQRARQRTLGDCETFAASVEAGLTEFTTNADGLEYTTLRGGTVPNSYNYPAESDYVTVLRYQGRVVVYAWRGTAKKGPHGKAAHKDVLPAAEFISAAKITDVFRALK